VAKVAARKATRFAALSREVAFFPGARELVRSLAREVPLAIASGALRHEIEGILAAGGLRDAFGAIVAAGEASAGKPDPAPYLLALRQLQAATPGIEAGQCLVIEDSPPGIASGLAAGMKVVGVASSYPPAELGAAHLVVDSLTQFRRSALGGLFEA
jgi:HAD superfamily hydrolase (TIGR01509 family)